MPIDLTPFLEEPSHCAVLVIECQEGVIGEGAQLPGLVASVRESGMLTTLSRLLSCARTAGARVVHCTVENRPDGLGAPRNTPLTARLLEREGGMSAGSRAAAIVKELTPEPSDVLAPRDHGMTAFHETGLDHLLRELRVETAILAGVSVNIAVTGAAIEAVNRGYRVVVPGDCVAGDPPAYARDALRYCLRNLAFVAPARQIAETWGVPWPGQ